MENTLIQQLSAIRCNLIILNQKAPFPLVECVDKENFDLKIAKDLLFDCENLIEEIEIQQCELLNSHSKVLKNFALKIAEMKDLRCPDNTLVDRFVQDVMDSTNSIDNLLPTLKMDIEFLWQRQQYISKYILYKHKFVRSKEVSRWKKMASARLNYCYHVGFVKYNRLNDILDDIQYTLRTSLQMLIRSIDCIEHVITYMKSIDECMLRDNGYVQEYLRFNMDTCPTIEPILMRSLDKNNCEERRLSCLKELMDLKKERLEIGRCLSMLYDFVLSFHGDFWFFESLRLFNALEILYSNDMKLHSIEMKIEKLQK